MVHPHRNWLENSVISHIKSAYDSVHALDMPFGIYESRHKQRAIFKFLVDMDTDHPSIQTLKERLSAHHSLDLDDAQMGDWVNDDLRLINTV